MPESLCVLIAEVFELEWLAKIAAANQRHNRLQIVTGFASDANFFALNLRLYFEFAVFNQFNDFLLYRALNTLLQLSFNKPRFFRCVRSFPARQASFPQYRA